jgi:hypothetical protein
MKQRADSRALSEGIAIPVEVTKDKVVIARVGTDGSTVNVTIEAGRVTVAEGPKLKAKFGLKRITFTGTGSVVGSGPELGDWDRNRAKPLPLTVELPLHGVFEFKKLVGGEWEQGPNRLLFVTPQTSEVSL